MVKFDMHCHAKEGSVDARISILEYADVLKQMGFSGMLISDHDSYRSYRVWKEYKARHPEETFEVIRGIEYDTIDAGHFLVIMPDQVNLKVLEIRGLPVGLLISLVHRHGGILGPAHPYGASFTSVSRCLPPFSTEKDTGSIPQKSLKILKNVDFIETFNAAEDLVSNRKAARLAELLEKPKTAGSDSHRHPAVGTAYTCFEQEIHSADDMIAAIRGRKIVQTGGISRAREKNPFFSSQMAGVVFQCYNKGLAAARVRSRRREWNHAMFR